MAWRTLGRFAFHVVFMININTNLIIGAALLVFVELAQLRAKRSVEKVSLKRVQRMMRTFWEFGVCLKVVLGIVGHW